MAKLDTEAQKLVNQVKAQRRSVHDWRSKVTSIKATLYATEKKGKVDLDKVPGIAPQGTVVTGGWDMADRKTAKKQHQLIATLRSNHNLAFNSVENKLITHYVELKKADEQIVYNWKSAPTGLDASKLKELQKIYKNLVAKLAGELKALVAKVGKTGDSTRKAMATQIKHLESKRAGTETEIKQYMQSFRAYMKADAAFRITSVY